MDLSRFENCVFVPAQDKVFEGMLYVLAPAGELCKNGFVVIPYQNPQAGNPDPRYYRIIETIDIRQKEDHSFSPTSGIRLQASTPKQDYIRKVSDLKKHILRGNIYEINYCMNFSADNVSLDPLDTFYKLHALAQAPYSMLVKLGGQFIISASPELFLEKKGDCLSTRPIKGTIRRGVDNIEDNVLKERLQQDVKERTEHVMAVDVARNDLSHLAKKGSVAVNKLYNIETFRTVHQMVSTVSCELRDETPFAEIIEATFPMASMTGAPKCMAMKLIDECEDFKRDLYSGTMGIIAENGDFTLSVVIRSVFFNRQTGRLSLAVGSAITYLSEPEQEYEECLLKAGALLKALNASI